MDNKNEKEQKEFESINHDEKTLNNSSKANKSETISSKIEHVDNKKTEKTIRILLFLILMMVTVMTTTMILALNNSTEKWEYKVTYLESTEIEEYTKSDFNPKEAQLNAGMINSYGEEGWELVDTYLETETVHPNYGNDDYVTGLQPNIRPQRLVMIFKRPLQEQ